MFHTQTFRLLFIGLAACGLTIHGNGHARADEPAIAYPASNWSYVNHSSTPAEGFLRGSASVINAAGQFNYYTSLAEVNRGEAIRRAIENEKLYVKTYFEIKEMRAQYYEKYGPKPISREIQRLANEAALPRDLTDDQYDRSSGTLFWPHILRQVEYEAMRKQVNDLFAARSMENSGDGSANEKAISQHLDAILRLMIHNQKSMTPQQFSNASAFLKSVRWEAKQESSRILAAPVSTTNGDIPADDVSSGGNVNPKAGSQDAGSGTDPQVDGV